LAKNREDYIRNVYFAASRLFVLQRIYYMAGDQAKAKEIAQVGDQITQNRIGFPKTKEENQKLVNRIYIN